MRLIATLLLQLLIIGCASQSGNFSAQDASRYASISVDQTTKPELYDVMGQPGGILFEENDTGWVYVQVEERTHGSTFVPFVGMVTGGGVYNVKATTFWFSSDGVLRGTEFETHNEYVNMWEGLVSATASMAEEAAVEQVMYDAVEAEMVFIGKPFTESKSDLDAVAVLWMVRRSI